MFEQNAPGAEWQTGIHVSVAAMLQGAFPLSNNSEMQHLIALLNMEHQLILLPLNKCHHYPDRISSCCTRAIVFPHTNDWGIDPGHKAVKHQPNLLLYRMKLYPESSALSHPPPASMHSHMCALGGGGFNTPACTVVHTPSSRSGTFYSPAVVSDILTRRYKSCLQRDRRKQKPEPPSPLGKKKQNHPLRLS